MITIDKPPTKYIERNYEDRHAKDISEIVLCLTKIAIDFANIKRVPKYTPERRENNAEHSFMLGLVAVELSKYLPSLDPGLVAQFALAHDLPELVSGDVATFRISDEAYSAKELAEKESTALLAETLPTRTATLLAEYEKQDLPEARFVRLVDKMLPIAVDIIGPGSQVMHEDYRVYTGAELDQAVRAVGVRLERMFPESELGVLLTARNLLAQHFSEQFTPVDWVQDTLFAEEGHL